MKQKIILLITFPFFILDNIISAYAIQYIFNTGIENPTFFSNNVIRIALVFFLTYILLAIVEYYYESSKFKYIQNELKDKKIKSLSSLLLHYHDTKKEETSKHLNLFSNNIQLLQDNYYIPCFKLIENICIFIISCIAVYIIHPLMLLCIFITFIPLTILPKLTTRSLNQRTVSFSKSHSFMLKKLSEFLDGIDVIYQYKLTSSIIEKSKSIFQKIYDSAIKLEILKLISHYLVQTFAMFTFVIEMIFGIYLFSKGSLQIGGLIAVIQLSNTIINPISEIVDNINKIKSVKEIKQNMHEIIKKEKEESTSKYFEDDIKVQNVFYTIHNNKILDNISFTLNKGDHALLQGHNGCGKSTLCKLIAQRDMDYKGHILVNQENMIYIDQDGFLFDESILYNMTFNQAINQKQLSDIIELCELTSLIEDKGIEFRCGVKGENLSGGEKQKIILARALLQDKDIYILDESLSAIDKKSREKIEQKIFSQSEKTMIYISHFSNQNIMSMFNKQITLSSGHVKEILSS